MQFIKVIIFIIFIVINIQAKSISVPVVVPVSWLEQHYNNPHLVIIDVRKELLFKKGHLKKAINMPVFRDLFVGKNLMMPKLSSLQELFSKAGIDNKSMIVVYGNNQPIWSARFYWISEVLGQDNVGLLKVGYGNWKKGTFKISTKTYHPKKTNFIPKVDSSKISTKLQTFMAIGKSNILDGRPKAYYDGKKSHAKRYGHIKSALNYPGKSNYEVSKRGSEIKSFNKLEKLYKDLPKDKKVILYCEDGADAALNFLVLQKLGYKASVYDGSWLEWGNDLNLPIQTDKK